MSEDSRLKPRTWQEIAADACQETDSAKLLQLAQELEAALEERDKKKRVHQSPDTDTRPAETA